MSKNYSILNVVVGMMIALGMTFGFQSCGQVDNPLEEIVNTVSEKTGVSPEEVSALIEAAMSTDAVQEALNNGTPIKVTISGGTSTTASDQTITIPMTTAGAGQTEVTIELTFTDKVSSSEDNPLVLKADEGSGNDSGESENNLVVSMPASSGLVVTIELPQTTVTLKSNGSGEVVYKNVTAKTATNTLNVESGVTIKDLIVEGGNVVINGGEVQNVTIAENQDITFTYDGSSTENMTIGAGASVRFNPYQSEDLYEENHPKIKTIIGDEGKTAKFYLPRFDRGPKPGEVPAEEVWEKYGNRLKGIEKISNCKVLVEEGDVTKGTDFTNVIFDNCELNGNNYLEVLYYNLQSLEWPEGNTITFNNCTFNFDHMGFMSPNLNEDHNNATLEFNNCIFKEGIDIYQFAQWANAVNNGNYTITYKFVDCKLGTATLTNENFLTLLPSHVLITQNQWVGDEDLGEGGCYFIHAIYQIGETKYVAVVTHPWTNEEQWEEKALQVYNPDPE